MKLRLALALAVGLALTSGASAQITTPNTLAPGAIIRAAELNTNFNTLGTKALNRITGGVIEGNVTLNAAVTFDGVDISAFLQPGGSVRAQGGGNAGAPAFTRADDLTTGLFFPGAGELAVTLGGAEKLKLAANGVTAYGVNIINASGKIPGLTSTYLASLDASTLTGLNGSQVTTGTVADARLSANIPLKNGANTFSATNTFGTVVTANLKVTDGVPDAGDVLTADAVGNATWQTVGVFAGAVPSGMIALFDAACPVGWTRFTALDGKFPRGGATYDALGGGADTHLHSVDAPVTSSTTTGAHTHAVDPAPVATDAVADHTHGTFSTGGKDTSYVNLTHTHSGTADSQGSHSHTTSFSTGGSFTTGGGASAVMAVTSPTGTAGAHTHNVSVGGPSVSLDHRHTITASTTGSGGTHAHTADVASTSTTTVGDHAHTTDVVAFDSATASNIPAYVQVVFCKKD
jgi:hypothetical protein